MSNLLVNIPSAAFRVRGGAEKSLDAGLNDHMNSLLIQVTVGDKTNPE